MNSICFTGETNVSFYSLESSSSTTFDNINPFEHIDVSSPQKVAEYFPQSEMAIQDSVRLAKELAADALNAIASLPKEKRDFINTLYAVDELEAFIHSRTQALWVVSMTHTEKMMRDEAKSAMDQMKAFLIEKFQCNKNLYSVFEEAVSVIKERGDFLTEQQIYYIEEKTRTFKKEGLHLGNEDLEIICDIKVELSELEMSFLKNIDDDKSHVLVAKEDLVGVPTRVINKLENINGLLKLTCNLPVVLPVIKWCQNEEIRKMMYKAFMSRADLLNLEVLDHLIEKRDELAKKLGYNSFAEYDLGEQMLQTPEKVQNFIDTLVDLAKDKTELEVQALLSDLPESVKLTEDKKIKSWDMGFLKTYYSKNSSKIDEEGIRNYFSFEPTLKKLFELYAELFELDFKQVSCEGLWHSSTQMVAVYKNDENNSLIGHVILDLFPREGKFSSGYCVDVLAPTKCTRGGFNPAIAAVLANFSPPNNESPSLLSHSELITLFHELGHCLHQLLGRAEMPTRSGYRVKTDFLELPSQLMEELLWEPDVLKMLGKHYLTGEPLPEEIIKKRVESRYRGEGYFVTSQMVYASMSLHYFMEGSQKNTKLLREDFEKKYKPFIATDPENHFEGTFRHLADPLYRCRYYSYLYAETLAKDVYECIKKLKSEGSGKPWVEYRKKILEYGGGLDPDKLLMNLLGKELTMDAYKKALKV